MICAFLHFADEAVLVLGFTHKDIATLASGEEPPPINIGQLAVDLGCPPPTRLQILSGPTDAAIQARIEDAFDGSAETTMLSEEKTATYMGTDSDPEEIAAAEAAIAEARALAVAQARARLN